MSAKRTGNSSRCSARGQSGPTWTASADSLTWVDHLDHGRACVEELEEWIEAQPRLVKIQARVMIDKLRRRAAEGRLWQATDRSTEIKPIAYDPDLYELRLKVQKTAMRFYHGEPAHEPLELWDLNRHIKNSATQQQVEIQFSSTRYRALLGGQTPPGSPGNP